MKITSNHVFFWGGIFSNWEIAEFDAEIGGEKCHFYNSEQYFMYIKALTFGDNKIAKEILDKGMNPKVAKELGRKVKNYNDKVWNDKRYQVMVDANMLKFKQNGNLLKELLSEKYEGKHFCEASPKDRIWGVGLSENDPLIDDEKNWLGTNLLGKVLDEVREKILKEF